MCPGVAAHDLRVVIECEKAGVDVDSYQKTLHTLDYYTATAAGRNDGNRSPRQLVVQFAFKKTRDVLSNRMYCEQYNSFGYKVTASTEALASDATFC